MQKNFVAAEKAYRKLRFAEGNGSAVYMYAATGYGKTRLVEEYLGDRKAIWLSAQQREWDLSFLKKEKKSICVVVDDMYLLDSRENNETLLKLARKDNIWLVMMGRIPTPVWLAQLVVDGLLVVIKEADFHLSADEVRQIATNENVQLSYDDAKMIADGGEGNAHAIVALIKSMKSGEDLNYELKQRIRDTFVGYLEYNIIPQWNMSLQEFLMQLSVVDEFTLPLAVLITGDNNAALMLENALGAGNFLTKTGDTYRLRPVLIQALRSMALKVLGLNKYNQCVNNAGLYYEMQNDYVKAIEQYEMSQNKDGIRNLLIRNSRNHIGVAHVYRLRKYYLELEEEEVETSPALMSMLSMLHSVMMNPEKSEYWYEKLRDASTKLKGGQKTEADEMLLYLDIGLPHRGSVDLADIIKRGLSLVASGRFRVPEFSVTNNQPSTMNGGKDFCNWSKRDQFMADTLGRILERMMGDFGKGLVHAALSESFYEKGGRDDEVLSHALMQQMEVDSGGKTELLFVSIGIQVRLSILSGNVATAKKLMDSFEERVRNEKTDQLIPGINALRCRVALVEGDNETVDEWLKDAPDEEQEFWTLDRYDYLTKVRCYIDRGMNTEAIRLLERLLYYADISKRTYIRMESKLFMAMALRREKREWKELLLQDLNEIQEYSFVRIISEKGAGILPLLKEIKSDYIEQKSANRKWFSQVLKETAAFADRFPSYLVCDNIQPRDFGETALKILKMQGDGMSIKAISQKLEMAERTVKYHAAENYRKLGAKGKTDAVQIARNSNLI